MIVSMKSILTSIVLLGLLGSTEAVGPTAKPQNAVDFLLSTFVTYPIIGLGRVEVLATKVRSRSSQISFRIPYLMQW